MSEHLNGRWSTYSMFPRIERPARQLWLASLRSEPVPSDLNETRTRSGFFGSRAALENELDLLYDNPAPTSRVFGVSGIFWEFHSVDAHLVLLPGDGIGPEVVAQAERVLEAVAARFGPPLPDRATCRWGATPSTATAIRCRTKRWPPAARPMPSCWGPSGDRNGTTRGPKPAPKRGCSGSARNWDCSPTCGRSPRRRICSTRRRSSPRSSPGPIFCSSAN